MLKRATMLIAFVSAAALPLGSPAAAETSDLCVANKAGCFATIQAAVDAAEDGDTIEIGPGTFAGGITILKSVQLVGTSVGATVIRGGGPVITVGEPSGQGTPAVSISRLTVTGGLNDSQPDQQVTSGGGVWIPSTGATVTITDSLITSNRVTPLSGPCGPSYGCASGGGIDNAGTLVVTNTRISSNEVGSTATWLSVASKVRGGGVLNRQDAQLTLRHSFVTGNRVAVTPPNGRLAVAGGISNFGALAIDDSVISDNTVDVNASFPGEVESFTGGIEVTGDASATITRTLVRDNSVRGANAGGDATVGVGGISTDPGVTFVLRDSAVNHNSVSLQTTDGSSATAFVGGLDLEGHVEVSHCQFIGNDVRATTSSGTTIAIGGGLETRGLEQFTISDSLVAANTVEANTTGGFVAAAGGGIFNGGLLTLRRTRVVDNRVTATGPAGLAQGGGIWNSAIPQPDSPPDAELTLIDSAVVANRLITSAGLEAAGGGVFTTVPVTLARTVIEANSPDQCFGC
jgi:hypothetical protein